MPQTQPDGRHITEKLSQAIREMRDFLLTNPSDANYYKTLYDRIEKLSVLVKTEEYTGYEHKNPHKTLREFLDNHNVPELVIKYYSISPSWSRKLINSSKGKKIKKSFEWFFDQLKKIKPDIKF